MSRFAICVALAASALTCSLTVQAAGVLSPLSLEAASAGTGMTGNWFKIDDNAKISDVMYTEPGPGGVTQAIKAFSWGTGIWSVQDLAAATNPANGWIQATATTTSAVSFANHTYNGLVPSYGTWVQDMDRPLVPASMGETNFVGLFSGFLYVEKAGVFDFGVFGDDGFVLTLTGAGGSATPLVKEGVLNSPGRELLTMQDMTLGAGYYGISLDFFNRLESGVIDLVWRPVGGDWQTIESGDLHASLPPNGVPEPGSLILVVVALASLWAMRRHAFSR